MIVLKTGTPRQFAGIRDFLSEAGYTAPAICERLGVADISSLVAGDRGRFKATVEDALDILTRVFLVGAYASVQQTEQLLPREVLAAMLEVGLLEYDEKHPELLFSPVMFYPVYGIYTASDRYTHPAGEPVDTPQDVVFPAISPHSGHFLSILPETPCDHFLDIGGGAGVAALGAAARYAGHAWSLDITERATLYALWNKALNGLENVTVLQGDLFQPVAGKTFDRIVTHPPYDANITPRHVYCDGGEDGESIIRRLFQDAPRYLKPGGRLYCMARVADLFSAKLEERVQAWTGGECDVAVIERELVSPDEVALGNFVSSRASHEAFAAHKSQLAKLNIEWLCYACIVVQKRLEQRPTFMVRRERGPRWESASVEGLLNLQTAIAADPDRIAKLNLRASPHLELLVRHGIKDGRFAPSNFTLQVQGPLKAEMEVQPALVDLVSRFTGGATPERIFTEMTKQCAFPSEGGEAAFLEIVRGLLSAGVLSIARPGRKQSSVAS